MNSTLPTPTNTGQCPQCGHTYAHNSFRFVDRPVRDDDTTGDYLWLSDVFPMRWPWREWSCKVCKTITTTLEVTIDDIFRITADSPSKAALIEEENYADKPVQWAARPRRNVGLMVTASAELAHIVGAEVQLRKEAIIKFWAYIKAHGLQDKKNLKFIHADELLRPVFEKEKIEMFEISEIFNKHMTDN